MEGLWVVVHQVLGPDGVVAGHTLGCQGVVSTSFYSFFFIFF